MYHRITAAVILGLLGGRPISAEEVSPTLSMLVEQADRITVAEVDAMRRAIEEKAVHTKNGQQIMGKFVFTYVDLEPSEHVTGSAVSTVTVRLLGGIHPDGTKFTTYPGAPALSSEERVLLFLKEIPDAGSNQQPLYRIAYDRGGKFRVEGEGQAARLVRPLPNHSLAIDPGEGIGEDPIPLARMKQLIQAELAPSE